MKKSQTHKLPIIGWREWVGLPDLNVSWIKTKVDTGARSCSLHASNIKEFTKDGIQFVEFRLHPHQRKPELFVQTTAKVFDTRKVKSSSGETTNRPVILTRISLMGQIWAVELTLANREGMGFRMLLGREAFRGKFIVDSDNSFYNGKPKKKQIKEMESESESG